MSKAKNNSNWLESRVGEVAELKNGYAFKSEQYDTSGPYRVITISNVQDGRLDTAGCKYIKKIPDDFKQYQLLDVGDILISMTGNVGRICKVSETGLLLNQRVGRIIPKNIYDQFFYYVLASESFRDRMVELAQGGAQPNLSVGDIQDYIFAYPASLETQRKIAEILRTWDEAIETAEAELKAKHERKRWLMTMVMQKSYETKSVSQFGTLKKGGAILREKLRSEGVPVVLYGDIYTKYSEIVTRLISRVDASAVVDGVKLNSGDIVFAGSGETAEEIGKCIAYVGEEAAYAGGDVVILCNHGQDPRYLGYALNSEEAIRQKMRLGQGSSVMHLYKDDVASIKIPLPPISDQRKVGEILSAADADIELINQRINVLRDQKRGLMQKLLTGEVRVAA